MLTEATLADLQLVRKTEARGVLRISAPTLDRLIARREIAVVRVGRRAVRIEQKELLRFIALRRSPAA